MLAKIHITLKKDVLDPQGSVIANSLKSLGFDNVNDVRQGKFIELEGDFKSVGSTEVLKNYKLVGIILSELPINLEK